MAVDLFSLRLNLETSGIGQAKADLTGIETSGRDAALQMTNFANAWTATAAKAKVAGAELAAFKAEFTTGFFNEKMIAGMSLSGQEAAKAGEGAKAMATGMKNAGDQWKASQLAAAPETVSALGGAFNKLASTLGPFVEIWAAFKWVEFVHGTIDAAAALHEVSQKTGASVEMLSVLKFAGAQAEVSMGDLTQGFRGLSLSLGRLQDGQKETVEAFAKLGLSATSFTGLNTDQAFLKIVEAMRGLPDGMDKSEIAMRVFGRSGSALIPLLDDLAREGFAKVRAEVEKNGGIITKEQADRADAFHDSLTRLSGALGGLMREVLIPILPPLTAFVSLLAEGAKYAKDIFTNPVMAGFKIVNDIRNGDPADWDAGDTGRHLKGGPLDRNRGEGLRFSAEELKKLNTDAERAAKEAKRIADEMERHRVAMLTLLYDKDTVPHIDVGSQGLGVPGMPARLPNETQTAAQPGQGHGGGVGPGDSAYMKGATMMQSLRQGLTDGLAGLRPFQSQLAGFFEQVFTTGKIGTSIKAFGKSILSGMGSIFAQMAAKAILAAPLFQAIGHAMSNPFTAGFALLAFGIALSALGASMGGTATGSGGGGGGGSANFDRATNITLVADGAGGFKAPTAQTAPVIKVLGKDSPEGQRMFAEYAGTSKRRGF